jgi:hypothetical protein
MAGSSFAVPAGAVLAAAGVVVMQAQANASAIFPCRMARTVARPAYRCAGHRFNLTGGQP